MQGLLGRENDYFASRREKLDEQTIGTSVEMAPYKQISIQEPSIKGIIFFP